MLIMKRNGKGESKTESDMYCTKLLEIAIWFMNLDEMNTGQKA